MDSIDVNIHLVSFQTTGEETVFCFWKCRDSPFYHVYVAWASLEKFILLFASLYFTFCIRKIEIKVLNEYKSTAIIVCSTIVLVIAADITLPILESRHLTGYKVTRDIFIFILISLYLLFTFVPKVPSSIINILLVNLLL